MNVRGCGVGCTFHTLPFQRSTNDAQVLPLESPTAVQAIGEVQDTPTSWVNMAFFTLATGWSVHLTPFQRSANAVIFRERRSFPSTENPTATHAVAEVQDTPRSCEPV